jgi:hypothetical protein
MSLGAGGYAKVRWVADPKIARAIDILEAMSAGDEVFCLLAAVTQDINKERLSVKLASKTACDSCAGLTLAIIERRVERQMHVCLSNNVAEEMTNLPSGDRRDERPHR